MDVSMGIIKMSSRTSASFSKKRQENVDGTTSMSECDSTTEPSGSKVQFQLDDDVYYLDDTGKCVLGTIEEIQGRKFKVVFLDGSEKWAPASRLKQIQCQIPDDDDKCNKTPSISPSASPSPSPCVGVETGVGAVSSVVGPGPKKKTKFDSNGQMKEQLQITCGSCGTQKMITAKKAAEFSPFTSHQYNCRKCINKSKTHKNNGVPINPAHYLSGRGRPKSAVEMNGTISTIPAKGLLDHSMSNGGYRSEVDICLHCRSQIVEKVSLHCTMCERPCHPSCLAVTPPPLAGDIFWSIICQVCGTQKPGGSPDNDCQKVYSSRRSITCWSDVAYLLLSCLGCRDPTEKFFNLDDEVIPFWEENVERLHLPRQYKSTDPSERRKLLLLALSNASLRFIREERRKHTLWGIKDHHRSYTSQSIKPPAVSGGRSVTAAGFPISVRASNPEAASVAMSTIAQTIAAQAAAQKANSQGVPTPKNSPSYLPPKSGSSLNKSNGASSGTVTSASRKSAKNSSDQQQRAAVARKTGSELNSGTQSNRGRNLDKLDIWPKSKYPKVTPLPELPKTGPNKILGSPVTEMVSSVASSLPHVSNTGSRGHYQANSHQKHVLLPSPGGAARVTGVVLSPSSDVTSRVSGNCGSYPVRKNGSSIIKKSVRQETVDAKRDLELNSTNQRSQGGGSKKQEELARESSNLKAQTVQKGGVKRKLAISPAKSDILSLTSASSSETLDNLSSVAKKARMSLPSSTEVTSKRLLPFPLNSTDNDYTSRAMVDSAGKQKKTLSPLQKLSDLQRNGGLTVACLTHTESGLQTVAMNPSSLEEAMDHRSSQSPDRSPSRTQKGIEGLAISAEKIGQMYSTPVKNSHGANSTSGAAGNDADDKSNKLPGNFPVKVEDNTKDSTYPNVTTSSPPPRAFFKLTSVASPGTAKVSPVLERRTRPSRTKRAATLKPAAGTGGQVTPTSDVKPVTRKLNTKIATNTALVKFGRGRPKKLSTLQKFSARRPRVDLGSSLCQFNGSAGNGAVSTEAASSNTVDETEFTWNNSSIQDLLNFGSGYRLGCLPPAPETKEELTQVAMKHLAEELTPRPPTYWSNSTSTFNHSIKKSVNRKSRRDLKDVDSYYICGRKIDQNGIQYQIVWRDGYGFECSSDDEEELGINFGNDYVWFEDYDAVEYFFDKMPVSSNNSVSTHFSSESRNDNDHCDNNDVAVERMEEDEDDNPPIYENGNGNGVFANGNMSSDISAHANQTVKREPVDATEGAEVGRTWTDNTSMGVVRTNGDITLTRRCAEPCFIDLTDSP